jgi:hypothetical protein
MKDANKKCWFGLYDFPHFKIGYGINTKDRNLYTFDGAIKYWLKDHIHSCKDCDSIIVKINPKTWKITKIMTLNESIRIQKLNQL